MEEKNRWHYNSEEFMNFAKDCFSNSLINFNYKSYITPYNETRELIGRIVEELQYLESSIERLIQCAVDNKLYDGKTKFNFDNYNPASKIINSLKKTLIEERIAKQLIDLMKFRNYIIHSYYLTDNSNKDKNELPIFLFMIFEANDYISNVINTIKSGAIHIQNVFEDKPTK